MRHWSRLNKLIYLWMISLMAVAVSCSEQTYKAGEIPVARAYDNYLYESTVAKIVPSGLSISDSLAFIKNYTDQWIKRQLLLKIAEFNLDQSKLDFTERIDDYKASLFIHEYEKQLVAEKVDTAVSQNQIEKYYRENLKDFVLSGPLVKALYVRIQKNNSKVEEIKNLLKSTKDDAFENLVTLCYQYADRFDFFDDQWVSFQLIVQNIPGSPEDLEAFLRTGSLMEIKDEEFVHFLQVHEYKLAYETAPIEYVYDRIKDLVLTQRRMDYLKNLEESVYQNAIEKKEFEVFEEK